MLFNSPQYLFIFLPIVFVIYFLFNKFKQYNLAKIFILLASLFFYGSYKIDYLYIIIFSISFNYFIYYLLRKDFSHKFKTLSVILAVLGNISILVFFKYTMFFVQLLAQANIFVIHHISNFILPLGISFFTLQQISFIVDCYKGKVGNYNIIDYALFVSFFPQLVSGPIVRHNEMMPQFNDVKNKSVNQANIYAAIFLIAVGLIKKTVFADNFTDFTYHMSKIDFPYDCITAWLLGTCKIFECYFDFSGYCDIALGSALLFNIRLPWNFNSPFKANDILGYWQRWNMTLIRFLKDYVYKPLGGNTKSNILTYINTFIMFMTMGIWVGFNEVSLLFGVFAGIFACINVFWQKIKIRLPFILSKILTLTTIIILGQFITSKMSGQVINAIKSMFMINCDFCNSVYIDGFNLIFTPKPAYILKLNIILLLVSVYLVLFAKNSNELAKIYLKENKTIYTVLLVFIFVFAVLSLSKTSNFMYFVF